MWCRRPRQEGPCCFLPCLPTHRVLSPSPLPLLLLCTILLALMPSPQAAVTSMPSRQLAVPGAFVSTLGKLGLLIFIGLIVALTWLLFVLDATHLCTRCGPHRPFGRRFRNSD